ncbi:MAG: hypothetical protein RL839_08125 [Gammaproteobacteria bacterium]
MQEMQEQFPAPAAHGPETDQAIPYPEKASDFSTYATSSWAFLTGVVSVNKLSSSLFKVDSVPKRFPGETKNKPIPDRPDVGHAIAG